MFAAAAQSRPLIRARATRQTTAAATAAAAAATTVGAVAASGKFGDENSRTLRSTRDKAGKDPIKDKDQIAAATTVVTRKRAVLGEKSAVTNTVKTQPSHTNAKGSALPTATAALKTRSTRTTAVHPKSRKSADSSSTISNTTTVRTKPVSATASSVPAPVSKLSRKTQQAIEAVVPVAPTKEAVVSRKPVKEVTPKDVAIVPSLPKAQVAAKKEIHVKEPILEEESSQSKLHIAKKAKTVDWDDLDAIDGDDPTMLSEYVEEIFEYMHTLENQTMANPNYMEQQSELQWKMRSILVDWLVEVHNKFRLLAETLFLAVNIIDRFLSLRVVSLVKLQLVGVTAMFIAAKYEEVVAPSIQNFLYMADGGYTDDEILRAERYVLQVLDFALQYPTPMSFLRRCSKADGYDIQTRTLAKYLMEVSLVDHRFICFPPSQIAAAGLYLARRMLDRSPWNPNLVHYSSYTEDELLECSDLVVDYLSKPVKYEALYKKYSARKFLKVAIFVEDWIAKQKDKGLLHRRSDKAIAERSSSGVVSLPRPDVAAATISVSSTTVTVRCAANPNSENIDPCQTVAVKASTKETQDETETAQDDYSGEGTYSHEEDEEDSEGDCDDGRPSSQSSNIDS
ncbi:hypothetical protein BASA50_009359 [Batrachochytrium salamandrivorans]|uniref:Cyclin N-terminal domain-containing protein n=1 Tax=Batrachochytrium salamandrivorans TaxID=1357716 RepID=A0ABQ8F1I2_9FUNG|nr:hypothetical protein BASA61_006536 [Batrachochytrium salamandrivorans]KAH6590384.1 hypothetical protein BASA50_009359 [Batrachochytrium salamandrivorans]KAH9255025.1 hypothetical protein BASA81_006970 [Batrachochytrium salamandrivorans]KAJ1343894.1 hypothetical protein BSLG_001555 [Batrachochytrium salamandrivorans]